MSKYYGLIIPRSYNDYYSRTDPQAIKQILALGIDAQLDAESENAIQNKAVAVLIPEDANAENQLTTQSQIDAIDAGLQEQIDDAAAEITAIKNIIPNTASETNELADKDFVNSTVGTNTANYIYKTETGGEKVPFNSIAELEAYTGTVTQNDYAFITGTDENGNIFFDRYKADVNGSVVTWAKEYRLNNSSFTAEQWAAIESGITAEKLAALETSNTVDSELSTTSANPVQNKVITTELNKKIEMESVYNEIYAGVISNRDFFGTDTGLYRFTFPRNINVQTGTTLKILFTGSAISDAYIEPTGAYLELRAGNGTYYPVKVYQNGALINMPYHKVTVNVDNYGAGRYWWLRKGTTLELMFNGSAWVVMGNPDVFTYQATDGSVSCSIKSDGFIEQSINGSNLWNTDKVYTWIFPIAMDEVEFCCKTYSGSSASNQVAIAYNGFFNISGSSADTRGYSNRIQYGYVRGR